MRVKLPFVNVVLGLNVHHAEAVFPDQLEVGDRVMVECEVMDRESYPAGAHVYISPVRESMWQGGEQHLWTWRDRQQSAGGPYIIRKRVAK